jgi:hypothetical protein
MHIKFIRKLKNVQSSEVSRLLLTFFYINACINTIGPVIVICSYVVKNSLDIY